MSYTIRVKDLSVLTYNIDKNKGLPRLLALVERHHPDVVAIQECRIDHDSVALMKKYGYEFSGHSYSFRHFFTKYSVATFYNPHTVQVDDASKLPLRIGFWDIVLFYRGGRRSVIKTPITIGSKKILIHNIHLSPFIMNTLRVKQLRQIFESLVDSDEAHIVLGDFNYPYGRKKLEHLLESYDLHEASNKIFHTFRSTFRFWPFKFKLDYIVYKNLQHVKTVQIDSFAPDHTPILAKFKL